MIRDLILPCSILLLLIYATPSSSEVIIEDCEYVMGDSDTKNDAKRLCIIEAKRKILDRAGTLLLSNTEIINSNLTKDEIRAYSAGIIKINTISENYEFNGKSVVVKIKLISEVDAKVLREKIKEIQGNSELAQQLRRTQDDYQKLEKRIFELQKTLEQNKDKDYGAVEKARLEREEAFNKLSSLDKIKYDIKQKSYLAVNNIEIGMTRDEVIKIIGPPRSYSSFGNLNYGNIWVVIENDVVTILVNAGCFVDHLKRKDYYKFFNPCGAGKGIVKY